MCLLKSVVICIFTALPLISSEIRLSDNWKLASGDAGGDGYSISTVGYDASDWQSAKVPSTILGTLLDNSVYADPFYSTNNQAIPDLSYYGWWYRTEFTAETSAQTWLLFKGTTYRADIWLNGQQIGSNSEIVGAFVPHDINVTGKVITGKNALAVLIYPAQRFDYILFRGDWLPYPADFNSGLWRDVILHTSESGLSVKNISVITDLPLPDTNSAALKVRAFIANGTSSSVSEKLKGKISRTGKSAITFEQTVTFGANESRWIEISSSSFSQLNISKPDLWWPFQMGNPSLYKCEIWAEKDGKKTDSKAINFGIREFKEYHTTEGIWGLTVNGQKMLVRGGGYCPEMFCRFTAWRNEGEMRYVKNMGLNFIRFEGYNGNDELYDICDREGICIMLGPPCYEPWESWPDPGLENAMVENQMREFRHHASLAMWSHGSDKEPPEQVQASFDAIIDSYDWRKTNAFARSLSDWGAYNWDGIKMMGPYNWEPAKYYWENPAGTFGGGAWGFCAEEGPGAVIPETEGLQKFIPSTAMWPINEYWNYHTAWYAGNIDRNAYAINMRYGESQSVEEFVLKAQLNQYESIRGMFESFGAYKSNTAYPATGVIQWMLNCGWPSLFWNLFDFYLKPNSATFATQKACRPLHISYDYAQKAVYINNETLKSHAGYEASIKVLNFNLSEVWSDSKKISISANASSKILDLPKSLTLSQVYFIKLELKNSSGSLVDDNFYWYSSTEDIMNYDAIQAYDGVESTQYAALAGIKDLPVNDVVSVTGTRVIKDSVHNVVVTLENKSASALAFFIRLEITKGQDGEEVVPVTYTDNYISLLPKESKTVTAVYNVSDMGNQQPFARIKGYNVPKKTVALTNVGTTYVPSFNRNDAIEFNIAGNRLFNIHAKGKFNASIMDLRGRTIFNKDGFGRQSFEISKKIPSGTYLLSVKDSEGLCKQAKWVIAGK
jgi:exo-1,4-beta-D-glucosaminidase